MAGLNSESEEALDDRATVLWMWVWMWGACNVSVGACVNGHWASGLAAAHTRSPTFEVPVAKFTRDLCIDRPSPTHLLTSPHTAHTKTGCLDPASSLAAPHVLTGARTRQTQNQQNGGGTTTSSRGSGDRPAHHGRAFGAALLAGRVVFSQHPFPQVPRSPPSGGTHQAHTNPHGASPGARAGGAALPLRAACPLPRVPGA